MMFEWFHQLRWALRDWFKGRASVRLQVCGHCGVEKTGPWVLPESPTGRAPMCLDCYIAREPGE